MNDDLDQIMHIMEAAFDPIWGEAWTRSQVLTSLLLPTTAYGIADFSGAITPLRESVSGFFIMQFAADEAEILLIGVHPHRRRQSIGNKLLVTACDIARDKDCRSVFLEVRENNNAIEFYKKFGFEQVGTRVNYYKTKDGSSINAITMKLSLN